MRRPERATSPLGVAPDVHARRPWARGGVARGRHHPGLTAAGRFCRGRGELASRRVGGPGAGGLRWRGRAAGAGRLRWGASCCAPGKGAWRRPAAVRGGPGVCWSRREGRGEHGGSRQGGAGCEPCWLRCGGAGLGEKQRRGSGSRAAAGRPHPGVGAAREVGGAALLLNWLGQRQQSPPHRRRARVAWVGEAGRFRCRLLRRCRVSRGVVRPSEHQPRQTGC